MLWIALTIRAVPLIVHREAFIATVAYDSQYQACRFCPVDRYGIEIGVNPRCAVDDQLAIDI